MYRPKEDAEVLAAVELVVRRYCDYFAITDPLVRADVITRVLRMFEHGVTGDVELMAKLLEADDR